MAGTNLRFMRFGLFVLRTGRHRFIVGALVFALFTPIRGIPRSPSPSSLDGWSWTYARPSIAEVVTAAIILLHTRVRQPVPQRTPAVQCQRFLVPEAIRAHQRPGGLWNVDLGFLERCLTRQPHSFKTRFVHLFIQLVPTPARSLKSPFGLTITQIHEYPPPSRNQNHPRQKEPGQ